MGELEAEAVELVRQYGFFMPKAVKAFLLKMATHLEWEYLEGELQ